MQPGQRIAQCFRFQGNIDSLVFTIINMTEYLGIIGFSENIDFPFRKIASRCANPLVILYYALMHDFIVCCVNKLHPIKFMNVANYFDRRAVDKTEAADIHRQFFPEIELFFAFAFAHSEQIRRLLGDSTATSIRAVYNALEREKMRHPRLQSQG